MNHAEPKPVPGAPVCPDYLTGAARDEWFRISALLASAGVLTDIDGTALAAYCEYFAQWREAHVKLRKTGNLIKTPNGYPVLNPYFIIAKSAFSQMARLLVEFGMTPSSRARVRVEKPVGPEDPLDAFLKQRIASSSPVRIQ